MTNSRLSNHTVHPIPFPKPWFRRRRRFRGTSTAEEVLLAIDQASRRIRDLARDLNCLGYFDDDDRPRAA